MSIHFTPDADALRMAHKWAGHEMVGEGSEQTHLGTRHVVAYCECGAEFITHPPLREAGR